MVAVALQALGGAFRSELRGADDEAAHYVTGLMVRAYIGALHLVSPMRFVGNYYECEQHHLREKAGGYYGLAPSHR
jgi:hypothetical protein